MNLLEKASIIKLYIKKVKKSISSVDRIDKFIVLSLLALIISPVIVSFISGISAVVRQKDIFLSPRCEELFGGEITGKMMRDFMEQNPDLRIRLLSASDEKEKGRGSSPDILIFDEGDFSGLAASGALLPLETSSGSETGERQLAIPLVSFIDLLFYNIELLKAAGFDRPPKTREEFLACAKAVSGGNEAGNANSGAALSLSPSDRQAVSRDIFSWIWAAGGDFWQGENAPVINNRQMTRDISFLGSLYREGAFAPGIFETPGDRRLEEFAQGKIAMMIASTSAIASLREKMGDGAFGVTAVPGSGSAGKYSASLSSLYAGISASCAYPDEALSFLLFLAGQSPLFCAELKAVPGIVSGLFIKGESSPDDFIWPASGNYINDDPFYSKARDIFESSQIIQGFSKIPGAQEFENTVREEIQLFFGSGRTAEETAAAIQRRWGQVNASRSGVDE